jgi:hypothetical protein
MNPIVYRGAKYDSIFELFKALEKDGVADLASIENIQEVASTTNNSKNYKGKNNDKSRKTGK